jgi:hypothetical protein
MSVELRLKEKAAESAKMLAVKLPSLRRDLELALSKVSELNRNIEIAETAWEQAQSFESRIGSRFQCPHCWIENHTRADLDSISTGDNDVFQCATCGRIEKFYARR